MSNQALSPIEVFYSYAHEDKNMRDELEKHLSILRRQGFIETWHDRKIEAGREWQGEIDKHLSSARVILLLVSPDFVASDYCWGIEVRRAMEQHESGLARVIPIILRPVDWEAAPFSRLQALPTGVRPVTSWVNCDEAFADIAQGIRLAVMQLQEEKSSRTADNANTHTPSVLPRGLQQIVGYAILGIDDESLLPFFNLFGDPPPEQTENSEPLFEDIYFDDFNEMKEVFDAMNEIVAKAKEAEERGRDRQKAFERAWMDKCISRASRYAISKKKHEFPSSAIEVPGIKYLIWGVHRDYARMIRALRPQEIVKAPILGNRNAQEIYFKNIAILPEIPSVIQKAVQDSNGDNEEFMRLLFEAVMRLRTFGPDSEVNSTESK